MGKDKLYEVMVDLRNKETKIDPNIFNELQQKDTAVSELLARLRAKVGNVERSGRVQLIGGVAPGFRSVPDGMPQLEAPGDNAKVDKEALLEMMTEEMGEKDQSKNQPVALEGGNNCIEVH